MTEKRGRKGRSEDLLPGDRTAWAREVWADREEVVKLPGGAWMLREAACAMGLPEETVDRLLSDRGSPLTDRKQTFAEKTANDWGADKPA